MSTLFIHLTGLLVSAHHSTLTPAVVLKDKLIYDLNPQATDFGVRLGMGVREAKTLIPELTVHDFNPKICESLMAEWLDIATLYTDEIEFITPHQAFLGLELHPRPHEIARLLLDHLERRFPYAWTAGLSPTKWIAKTLARNPLREIDLSGLALANEWVSVLDPLDHATRERLIFLGYKKVKDVQNLSIDTLKTQFGTEAHHIQTVANGGFHEHLQVNYPARRLRKTLSFPGGCGDLEQLKDALGDLSRKLFNDLNSEGLCAKDIHLKIDLEDADQEVSGVFAKPFRGALGLQLALVRLLEEKEFCEPIFKLTVTLPNLSPANLRQRSLAGLSIGDTSFTEDALESVRHKFGTYIVHAGIDHIEPRRIHVLRAWAKATGWQ